MIWISAPQEAAASALGQITSPWLVDEFVRTYVCWREASAAVKDAYEHWTGVDDEDQGLAFAAYRAALDGEELAARTYRECTERIAGHAR
jgi:hypothetical protein